MHFTHVLVFINLTMWFDQFHSINSSSLNSTYLLNVINTILQTKSKNTETVNNICKEINTNLSVSGPNDSGLTCANLMNGFRSKLPTSILIFDSTNPTLQEVEHVCY